MNQKLRCIASITLGCTIVLAPVQQASLAHSSRDMSMEEQVEANEEIHSSIYSLINRYNIKLGYVKDTKSTELLNNLGKSLLTKYSTEDNKKIGKHFNIGDLDGDNIPEIIVYKQRDFKNLNDEGSLVLYKYKDGKYKEMDKISMNYANTVESIVIGQGVKGKNAIFVNTSVGAHSGEFQLFTVENGRLKSRINSKKARLLSVYLNNEIKDIDNDGILEFCVYIVDPESSDSSSAGSDKINLWYKWDGQDGVELIKYEKVGETEKIKKNTTKISYYNSLIKEGKLSKAYDYLESNKNKLSIKDNSDGVRIYLSALNEKLSSMNETFNEYQEKYKMFENQGIMKEYNLKVDNLNDVNIIKKSSVFSKEKDLKELLLNARNMGLKVATAEGSYYFVIDYEKFTDISDSVSSEISDYLKIFAAESSKPGISEERIKISLDEIAPRIGAMEEFELMYPYSKYLTQVNQMHEYYLRAYIFSTYDIVSYEVNTETLKSYEKAMEDYDYLVLSDILKYYTEGLNESDNKVTQDIMDKMNKLIDEMKLIGAETVEDKLIKFESNIIDFSKIEYESSETKRDEKLEKAIVDYLEYNKERDGKLVYYYNNIDLNGDGKEEAFVYLIGQSVSGSGGSTALIIEQENYEVISKFTLVRNPIIISKEKTNGWNDIIMQVSGGGAEYSYVKMKFDGEKYPSNPSTSPKLETKSVVEGLAIISNRLSIEDGIEIK